MNRGQERLQFGLREKPSTGCTPTRNSWIAKPPTKRTAKRQRQTRCRSTPHAVELRKTPALLTKNRDSSRDSWPSSTQRKFEELRIGTPVEFSKESEDVLPSSKKRSPSSQDCSTGTQYRLNTDYDDDGFVLFSQSTYERQVSQGDKTSAACREDKSTPGFAVVANSKIPNCLEDLSQICSIRTHSVEELKQPEPQTARISGTHGEESFDIQTRTSSLMLATTPELVCGGPGITINVDGPAGHMQMPASFNIFLPKSQQRFLILIRHGESEFNRAIDEHKDFRDPLIFDPHLTSKGIAQARSLRARLEHQMATHGEPLWVVSPLRRAVETFLEACPSLHNKEATDNCNDKLEGSQASSSSSLETSSCADPKVEILPLISEFLGTAGDVGSSSTALAKEYPSLASHLQKIPECWWFQDPKKPNCVQKKQIGCCEPRDHRKKRVSELARWLGTRKERFIIMIGHSSFWHEFRGRPEKYMANGEMCCMNW